MAEIIQLYRAARPIRHLRHEPEVINLQAYRERQKPSLNEAVFAFYGTYAGLAFIAGCWWLGLVR